MDGLPALTLFKTAQQNGQILVDGPIFVQMTKVCVTR